MPVLKFGSQGAAVVSVQGALISGGFLRGPADGVFGLVTQAAVIAFQKTKGLRVDGVMGSATLAMLIPGSGDIARYARGVDVSHYQGTVNWQKVSAAGFSFVYAKASESIQDVDINFSRNWSDLKGGALLRGAYHFFDSCKDPAVQAALFCKTVGPLASADLPPMLDFEDVGKDGLSPDQRMSAVLVWLQAVEAGLGKRPILYTNAYFFEDCAGNSARLAGYKLWVAQYPADLSGTQFAAASPPPAASVHVPSAWSNWSLWQYTAQGCIPGAFSGGNFVDFDVFQGGRNELIGL